MSKSSQFAKTRIATFWWATTVFFLGLALTFSYGQYQDYRNTLRIQAELSTQTQTLVEQIQRKVNLYISTLRSGAEVLDRGFFDTFDQRFLLFCQSQRFQNSSTGINEIGFIPAISLNPPVPQNLITHLCSVPEGMMVKYENNRQIDPIFFETLKQPIGVGQIVASPFFELLFRPNAPKTEGQVFYYPIGNYDSTVRNNMAGNPKLVGWLFLTLRKSFFAEQIHLEKNDDLRIKIEAVRASPKSNTIIYESSKDITFSDLSGAYYQETSIPVATGFWRLTTSFNPSYISQITKDSINTIWIIGVALSLCASFLITILRMRYQITKNELTTPQYPETVSPPKTLFDSDERIQRNDQALNAFDVPEVKASEVREVSQGGVHTFENGKLWDLASYDPITQLPAKPLFMDRLTLEIRRAERDGHMFGLIALGIDDLPKYQKIYSKELINELFNAIGQKTLNLVRNTDTVAYLGSSQFFILLAQQKDLQHLTRVAYKILEEHAQTIELQGHGFPITISLGLSIFPDDTGDPNVLLNHAEYALKQALNQGGNRVSFYSHLIGEVTGRRQILAQEIRKALDRNQLFVRFQPVVNLQTGKVNKAEALIRWDSPEHGEIRPQEFITIAEDAGLIVEIGNFVFLEAVYFLRKWKKVLPPDFQISVNLSPVQLRLSKKLAEDWRSVLNNNDVSAESITLEITEGILLQDDRQIIQSIYELREAGIRFCLDDFGTGYSSISYLRKLNFDFLKIDQSFVRDLINNDEDKKIVEGVLLLAKKMNIECIAEGVETRAQIEYLRKIGCEYGQGFFFARAMLANDFIEWSKDRFN